MNRLIKQTIAAAGTLMLASAAHANLVTYDFTGTLNIGPMGQLDVPKYFSGHVSFHDTVHDSDRSSTHGEYVDFDPMAEFEVRIGKQDFVVNGGGKNHAAGRVQTDIYNNDPSIGIPDVDNFSTGGGDAFGIFATNRYLSMSFFLLYDPSVFYNDRIPSTAAPNSGSGGFFIDAGNDGSGYSGWFDTFYCATCKPVKGVPEPGMLTLSGAGLLMMAYALHRRRKASRSDQQQVLTLAM